MKLFNKTIDTQLFKQYSIGSDLSKQKVVAKIFNPFGRGTWYIVNSDPSDPDYLWAIVDLGYGAEVGSVRRSDLENYRGRFGLGFERDLSFDPINAEELYNGLRQGKFYADGGNVIDAFQIRTIKGEGIRPNEILTTEQEVKFKKGGKISESSSYIPTYEILKVHTKDGKVFENIYAETAVISGIYVSDKPLREKNPVGKNQMELFKKGGIPKTAIYIPRYNVDFIETENNGEIEGNYIYGGIWVDMKKQFRLVEEAKEQGRFNRKNEILKFEAIYKDKKISIDAKSLSEAKTKAIAQLKVPKTKVGLLSVYNVKDPMALMYDNGGALSDADRNTLIYVNQILRRTVINGDLNVDEANSGLAFEIAKEEVEEFIDDDMDEMGSSDFGYMYRNFIESYKSVKGESFAKGGSIKDAEITKGKVFKLANGDVIEIVRLFKENIDEDWVEYKRNGEKKENSVKELRLFINRLSGKIQKSFRERRNEYLEKLGQKEADVWDKIGAESGSEIRGNEKMLKAYAEGVEEMLQKEGVGKGSFDQEDYDYFTDENSHLFNEFLVWNSYYEPEMTKTEKAWREKNYADPKSRNYVSNPKIISLSSDSKPKSSNYVPKAKIQKIILEKDGKEIVLESKDVLNGVNLYEGGGKLKNDHVYFAKRFVKEVITEDGNKLKPSNGYWVKKSALKSKIEPKSKSSTTFKKQYKFEVGDIVWDKGNKSYGVVLNNFDNPIDGDRGEIRLDSDGRQTIFKTDKNYKEIGYNLVPYGSKEDTGDKKLNSLKNSAKRIIDMTNDKENKDFYIKTYSKLLKTREKQVGRKNAGSQKVKNDNKMVNGGSTKRGSSMQLAKQIRKEGESWQDALKRANEQLRNK
jgi:hypothetical protein